MSAALSDEELQDVYTWVDQISLSRPKKNISRDFSDGVLVAEIVKSYYPKIVDLHNYSAANGMAQKVYNWETLNKKIFKKLGMFVNESEVNDLVSCKPYVIERVLLRLRSALAQYRLKKQRKSHAQSHANPPHYGETKEDTMYRPQEAIPTSRQQFEASYTGVEHMGAAQDMDGYHFPLPQERPAGNSGRPDIGTVPQGELNALLVEKDQTIRELRETVHILEQKTKKLQQLVALKDSKIQTLIEGLQAQ